MFNIVIQTIYQFQKLSYEKGNIERFFPMRNIVIVKYNVLLVSDKILYNGIAFTNEKKITDSDNKIFNCFMNDTCSCLWVYGV